MYLGKWIKGLVNFLIIEIDFGGRQVVYNMRKFEGVTDEMVLSG